MTTQMIVSLVEEEKVLQTDSTNHNMVIEKKFFHSSSGAWGAAIFQINREKKLH